MRARPLERFAWLVGLLLLLLAGRARADDLADEADLLFRLGARAYQQGQYETALEHFLASNRLVPNKNALFNIARTYQELSLYPEAFRYYSLALDQEDNPRARAAIERALGAIRANVAVLDVVTVPAGATLYVDRKDLGPRGTSPRKLGLAPGNYALIAELSGYEPVRVEIPRAPAGSELPIRLELKPILGDLEVDGLRGATLTLDQVDAAPACTLPCRLALRPGQHKLFVTSPGHRRAELGAQITAHASTRLEVELEPLTGGVVLSSDEPGALIRVDGHPLGFTPAILTLPVGRHELDLTLSGFRDVKRSILVTPDSELRLELALTRSEEITAASRVSEQVEDAPSSVSVIGEQELRQLDYPTIAEALRGTPGVYLSDDRSYVTLGLRGLGRLGNYGNRILVLQDGQPMNDDWLGSSYVGFDAESDLSDVERIELVRGPGSVLYGTNAVSGVVNVVSRRPTRRGTTVGLSTTLDGVARAHARSDVPLGATAGAWASVAAAHGRGRDFFFPEYADTTLGGVARDVDGMDAATLHGGAYYRALSVQWSLHTHTKHLPSGEYQTSFGDARTRQTDTRSFVEVKFEPELARGLTLLSRVHLNHYRFRGEYARTPSDGGLEVDTFRGTWVGVEERLQATLSDWLRLTAGGEGQSHFQVDQTGRTDDGYFLNDAGSSGRPYRLGALYALCDLALGARVRLSLGARLDSYSNLGSSLNPRVAAIFKPYAGGNTKLLWGKAFRAPSVYELYYNDGGYTQIQSPNLKPESIYSFEVEHSHRFSSTLTGTLSLYANYVTDLITPRGGDANTPLQYANESSALLIAGGELGLRREFRQGLMLSSSLGVSHGRFLKARTLSALLAVERDPNKRNLENSPGLLASLKAALPIWGRALGFATRLTVESERFDRYENRDDPPQGKIPGAAIWDWVLSGDAERANLHYAVGVYNAFDWRYRVPVSGEFLARSIEQSGRTFLASAELQF